MAEIRGIDGMNFAEIERAVEEGARFVQYQWAISIILASFRNPGNIHFIPAGQSAFLKGLPLTLLTLVLGWWGIPWGPIYTVQCVFKNSTGGHDLTNETLFQLRHAFAAERQQSAFGPG